MKRGKGRRREINRSGSWRTAVIKTAKSKAWKWLKWWMSAWKWKVFSGHKELNRPKLIGFCFCLCDFFFFFKWIFPWNLWRARRSARTFNSDLFPLPECSHQSIRCQTHAPDPISQKVTNNTILNLREEGEANLPTRSWLIDNNAIATHRLVIKSWAAVQEPGYTECELIATKFVN